MKSKFWKTYLCEFDLLMILLSPYLEEELVKYKLCDKLRQPSLGGVDGTHHT